MSFSPEVDQEFCHPTIWSIVNQIWPSILEIWFGTILQQIFGRFFTKKPHFGRSKNEKWFFCPKKMKTSLGNIVCHSNMHPCAQYQIMQKGETWNEKQCCLRKFSFSLHEKFIFHFPSAWNEFFYEGPTIYLLQNWTKSIL